MDFTLKDATPKGFVHHPKFPDYMAVKYLPFVHQMARILGDDRWDHICAECPDAICHRGSPCLLNDGVVWVSIVTFVVLKLAHPTTKAGTHEDLNK